MLSTGRSECASAGEGCAARIRRRERHRRSCPRGPGSRPFAQRRRASTMLQHARAEKGAWDMFLAAVARHSQEARTCSPLPGDRSESCSKGNTKVTKNSELGADLHRAGPGDGHSQRRWVDEMEVDL